MRLALIFLFAFLVQPLSAQTVDVEDLSTRELLDLYVDIQDQFRQRGVSRSANALTGNLAEYIFLETFGWKPAKPSQKGFDAKGDGIRYQIKARRFSRAGGTRQMGAIRDLDGFDVLAVVLFDRRYSVVVAALIPAAVVRKQATYVSHTNSYRFMFDDSVLDSDGVINVTADLKRLGY